MVSRRFDSLVAGLKCSGSQLRLPSRLIPGSLWPSQVGGGSMSEGWSHEELEASVRAYFDIWNGLRTGRKVVKSAYYSELAGRFNRSAKAFEYRMQNISYVLTLMGRDWLPGLKPAKNVGAHMAASIESIIHDIEHSTAPPVAGFERQVRESRGRYKAMPMGSAAPSIRTVTVAQHLRDPAVKAWILDSARGRCEACNAAAPFEDVDGLPFLEVHHVRRLADGGSDTATNAVALCPNCHRALHYSRDAKSLTDALYLKVARLVRE